MEEPDIISTDSLLRDLGGCGLFQLMVITFLVFTAFTSPMSVFFMSFGIYNPGWRCLDNTTHYAALTNTTESIDVIVSLEVDNNRTSYLEYQTDSCEAFDSCRHVQFNPAASTIVTEWGLICGKSWIPSMTISIQMAGMLLGLLSVGFLSDRYGRKLTLHVAIIFQISLEIISVCSVSWEMFTIVNFFLGFMYSFQTLVLVLQNEFVLPQWRMIVSSIPMWAVAITLFSVSAMLTRNWKTIKLIICVISAISFVLMFWVPKSLRWLAVNKKTAEAQKVVKYIAKYNRAESPNENVIKTLIQKNSESGDGDRKVSYTLLDVFRKGYRIPAITIGIIFCSTDMIYFALSFGISALPGNIYENMIILTATEIPANIISASAGDIFGRKKSMCVLYFLLSLCLFSVVVVDFLAPEDAKPIATLVLVVMGKLFLNAAWYILALVVLEIYPTVVRGTVNSYARMMSVIGTAFAPFLIPSTPSLFYICYLAMGGLTLVSTFLLLLLPETKGKALQNTWDTNIGEEKRSGVGEEKRSGVV